LRERHDRGHARLVVRAEQGGAVGGDDVVANLLAECRILRHPDHLLRIADQPDIAAVIVPDDLRLDIGAGEIRRGVDMRAEADDRYGFRRIGRNSRIDIAMLVEMRILDTDPEKFIDQQTAEILLLLGGGLCRRCRV
jgi:hypothetical protein